MAVRKQLSRDEWPEGDTGRLEETREDKRKHRGRQEEEQMETDGWRLPRPITLACSVELVGSTAGPLLHAPDGSHVPFKIFLALLELLVSSCLSLVRLLKRLSY